MKPKTQRWMKAAKGQEAVEGVFPRVGFGRSVARTALLNLAILASALPFAFLQEGGLQELPLILLILVGVSLLVWTLHFAILGLILVVSILCGQVDRELVLTRGWSKGYDGIADEWLDDPI